MSHQTRTRSERARHDMDTPLWRFALTLWADQDAADACLALQRQGWQVTRILCAGWLAQQGRTYSGDETDNLRAWRGEITESIRALKKSLSKSDSLLAPLRESLAQSELEAERFELYQAWQTLVAANPKTEPQGPALAEKNLRQAAPAAHSQLTEATLAMIQQLARHIATAPRSEPS